MFGTALLLFALVASSTALKPEFNSPYQNETLEYGRVQMLICSAFEGEKPITYKWYNQDGDEITEDREKPIYVSEYKPSLSSMLIFNRTSRDHEGSYMCLASNVHGLARKVFYVRVPPPSGLKPEFRLPAENVTMVSGKMYHLLCNAEGEKPITYKWYNQNETEITGDSKKHVFVSSGELVSYLIFNKTSTKHEGPYTCTASNVNGEDSKVFLVRVRPPGDGNETNIDQGNRTSRFLYAKVPKITARSVTFNITTSGPVKYIEAKYREVKRAFRETTIRLDPVPGNIYEIGNLLPGGSYIFRFRTVPSESNHWSREYNITLFSEAPEVIFQISGDQNVKLQWFTEMDQFSREAVDKYQIIYFPVETVGGNSWTTRNCSVTIEVPTCAGSSYTIAGLERRILYQIEVRAHTRTGFSEPWRQKVNLT